MFKLDSPLMNFLNKVADIMILNCIVIIFSIPIFTAGAALTAAYYMGYKMVKNEESYILKGFWHSFKDNFKQSTILWIIMLVIVGVIVADYRIVLFSGIAFSSNMRIMMLVVTVVFAMGAAYVFPMQARYTNTVKNTLKNSILMALAHLPTSFLLVVVCALPIALVIFVPQILPATVLLALGLVIYFQSFLLMRVFGKYEGMYMDGQAQEGEKAEDISVEEQETAQTEGAAEIIEASETGEAAEISEASETGEAAKISGATEINKSIEEAENGDGQA